jgi:Spy/CpxP family protein refolding chaperone
MQGVRGLWVAAAVILMVAGMHGGGIAWAQAGADATGRWGRMGRFLTGGDRDAVGQIHLKRAQERLGLTDQQAEEIRTTLRSLRDEARADIQALREARQEFRQLLQRQDSDPEALKAAADRMKALQGMLMDRRLEAQLAIRSKLTPEQWAKWLQLRKKMTGHRWMGRGRSMGL